MQGSGEGKQEKSRGPIAGNITFVHHPERTVKKGRAGCLLVPCKKPKVNDLPFVECPLPTDKDTIALENAPSSCVICTANVPICVIMPCMHKVICCDCGRKLTADGTKERGEVECPICKAEVHRIAKVFE